MVSHTTHFISGSLSPASCGPAFSKFGWFQNLPIHVNLGLAQGLKTNFPGGGNESKSAVLLREPARWTISESFCLCDSLRAAKFKPAATNQHNIDITCDSRVSSVLLSVPCG